MKPYYYVYRTGGKAPFIKHYSIQDAQREAERLSPNYPNSEFEILMCVAITKITNVSTKFSEGIEAESLT